MLVKTGRVEDAVDLLRWSVDRWARVGPLISFSKDYAKLGYIEAVRQGQRSGFQRIKEALDLSDIDAHLGFRAQMLNLAVQAAYVVDDSELAREYLESFLDLCQRHHLHHQVDELRQELSRLACQLTESFPSHSLASLKGALSTERDA